MPGEVPRKKKARTEVRRVVCMWLLFITDLGRNNNNVSWRQTHQLPSIP
jgi:hypothetical protein